MTQLSFQLPHLTAMGAADFYISDSNGEAVAWLDRWPRWPHPALVFWGPQGSGKTHLAHVWQARSHALFTTASALPAESQNVILDFSNRLPKTPQEEIDLLHFMNSCYQNNNWLLLLSREAPTRWNIQLPDLRSRLNAIPLARIDEPDDALLSFVLAKHFSDRQLPVRDEIINYLVKRIDRSFQAVTDIVDCIDRLQLQTKRPFGLSLARDCLKNIHKDQGI